MGRFNDARRPWLTQVLLAIMVVLFVLMEIKGGSRDTLTLIRFGAKFNPLIIAGEYWRFITPVFLHIGFFHLLMNGVAIYYVGKDLEAVYGTFRYLFIFLFSGLMGNVFSFAFNDAVSAGASTSIFGLFATYLVLARANPHIPQLQAVSQSYKTLILINIIFNLFSQSVDIPGHIGGLVGGYLSASLLSYSDKRKKMGYALLAIIILFLAFRIGIYRWADFY